MATALDLIKGAYRLISVIAEGETPEAEDANIGLEALNAMLDAWKIEPLLMYDLQDESFPLTAGDGSYSIGAGQDFNTTRPETVVSAYLRDSSGTDRPLVVFEFDRWDQIPDKDALGTPEALTYEPSYPHGQIKLWPAPAAPATLHIRTYKALSGALSLTSQLLLPAGYERAIRFNLAVELAPEFGREAPPTVLRIALESRANLKVANTRVPQMQVDSGLLAGRFNIISGDC